MHVAEYLASKGLKPTEAAEQTGFSAMAFTHWVNGRSMPKRDTLTKLGEWSEGAITGPDCYVFFEAKQAEAADAPAGAAA